MLTVIDPLDKFDITNPKRLIEACGYIPGWLAQISKTEDTIERLNDFYAHGGGWDDFSGFELYDDGSMTYPEDPTLYPLAKHTLQNGDTVWQYRHAWVRVKSDTYDRVARMD